MLSASAKGTANECKLTRKKTKSVPSSAALRSSASGHGRVKEWSQRKNDEYFFSFPFGGTVGGAGRRPRSGRTTSPVHRRQGRAGEQEPVAVRRLVNNPGRSVIPVGRTAERTRRVRRQNGCKSTAAASPAIRSLLDTCLRQNSEGRGPEVAPGTSSRTKKGNNQRLGRTTTAGAEALAGTTTRLGRDMWSG